MKRVKSIQKDCNSRFTEANSGPAGIVLAPPVGRDSVEPTFERSEANVVSIVPARGRGARTACGGLIGSAKSRPTFRFMDREAEVAVALQVSNEMRPQQSRGGRGSPP